MCLFSGNCLSAIGSMILKTIDPIRVLLMQEENPMKILTSEKYLKNKKKVKKKQTNSGVSTYNEVNIIKKRF